MKAAALLQVALGYLNASVEEYAIELGLDSGRRDEDDEELWGELAEKVNEIAEWIGNESPFACSSERRDG